MLTTENIEQVVGLLKELLIGKKYTFIACNEYIGDFRLDVRTSQSLKDSPFSIWRDEEKGAYAGFNVSDSYGVWGCLTTLREDKYDGKYDNPYIVFEHNKVTITHRAASGALIYWCAAVEQDCP
jgi:hypothetical protein